MKTVILEQDPNDDWAMVELYRWQYGGLPEVGGVSGTLDVSAGLLGMAEAIEAGDESNFPSPFNVASVLKYAAKLIEGFDSAK